LAWKSGIFSIVLSYDILEEYMEVVQELQNRYPTVKALEIKYYANCIVSEKEVKNATT